MKGSKILFHEVQLLRESPVKWLMLISSLLAIAGISILAITGNIPTDEMPVAFGITIPVLVLSYLLIHVGRLETVVTDEGIFIKWKPLNMKLLQIHKHEIDHAEPRKSPAFHYGFGMWPGYGAIHNVKGRDGLQLYLKNGKKVFIGTQDSFLFRKALEKLTVSVNKIQ